MAFNGRSQRFINSEWQPVAPTGGELQRLWTEWNFWWQGLISKTGRKTVTPIKGNNSLPSFHPWMVFTHRSQWLKTWPHPQGEEPINTTARMNYNPILPERDLNIYVGDRTLGETVKSGGTLKWPPNFKTKTWSRQPRMVHRVACRLTCRWGVGLLGIWGWAAVLCKVEV